MAELIAWPERASGLDGYLRGLAAKKYDQNDKGTYRRQKALLKAAAKSSSTLAGHIRDGVQPDSRAVQQVPRLSTPITVDEYHHPQLVWERKLHTSLTVPASPGVAIITRADAAQPAFWWMASLRWLETGGYAADPPARTFTAVPRKTTRFSTRHKATDTAARNLLRRIGGLPTVRTRTGAHIQDCPAAAAWWRCELLDQILTVDGYDHPEDQTWRALKKGWATVAQLNTAMNVLMAPTALAALVAAAIEQQADTHKQFEQLRNRLGSRAAGLALESLPFSAVRRLLS